ncbi:MAG: bifunctional 23S rRNA (guanine(2069)-N(7))-methyltransferase RlmK/23S rRNA (guanine(2445)-N(2))-methyltransferase RlmL [Actinomycetia bacterium]|nr:bifunctional 23S rRNA (guanine(2069)-N(7))-methyltransferase RlmK/23S rRNA (guanine(2445)-N(2))-methyltransferase RlmL [Actinomycetes bacterium]
MPGPAPTQRHQFFATCPRNTEGLLLEELRSLGAADAAETRAGVAFSGELALAFRACLWSRVASRIILKLSSFAITGPDDLYEAVHGLPWEDHLDVSGTLAVEATSTVRQGPLARLNTHFAEQRVKDAIVDRFRAKTGKRPGVELRRPDVRISLHLGPAEAIVGLDLSGEGLHRRGYRPDGGEAPLKENLAAAILIRAGWPRVAATGGVLVDPMCGSGTLLIEGAWMAADIAPGMLRDYYGFLGWKGFEPTVWDQLLDEARERRRAGLKLLPALFGFDLDRRTLEAARGNARRAGLAGRVVLDIRALAALEAPEPAPRRGLVITNPPYGRRLGETEELVDLYETLGARLKGSFSGWEAAVFTGNPELTAHLGLRAHRVNVLYNGPLQCKLLLFHIGEAGGARTAARGATSEEVTPPKTVGAGVGTAAGAGAGTAAGTGVAGTGRDATGGRVGGAASAGSGAAMFGNRLRKNLRHLRRWAARSGIHCYRLYDADLPEYAVAIDLYEDWAHVQEYAPPGTVDPVRARRRLREVMAVVPEILEIPPEHAVLKVRRAQRGADQYQKLRDAGTYLEVHEAGLRFLVNLTDYLDTGLFLDHRPTRALIRELAPGRRFLNLFGYTGSATVYAAAGGAVSTTTVDLSAVYLDWARRNLELNGFYGPEHGFVRADCLEWLSQRAAALEQAPTYDLIFLDAPTFSNSKSMRGTLDIQRDHAWLIRMAVRLLSPHGILLFSTNFRHFRLDPALATQLRVADITRQTIPPDFARNPRIHACFRVTAAPPEGAAAAGARQAETPRSLSQVSPDGDRSR